VQGSKKQMYFGCPFFFLWLEMIVMERNGGSMFAVENALEMIFMFDRTGKIIYANAMAKRMLNYGDEIYSKNISEVFPNTFKAEEGNFKAGCVFGEELQNFVAYRKNLTCFPVQARVVNNTADSDMYICMANDMLKKEFLSREIGRVRQEAQQAMKVKSEFVANITHELRTPVNGILGNVRELMSKELEPQVERPLKIIERCCNDMNKIINNILDFSKLEAGKFTLEPRKFDFRNMLDYVKANHINKITEKGLEFFMTVSPQVPQYIIGDELRIVQVLNNLLSNALKFTAVGQITVEVIQTAQVNDRIELFFIVKDSGIGIDNADKDKLFQSFSQVDASISRKYGGTGLGLNICKQLVELMGGTIEVESKKNHGSTFSFSIWAGVCSTEAAPVQIEDSRMSSFMAGSSVYEGSENAENIRQYGTAQNQEALKKNLSKLILCVEMENWEKAEMFMETIRQLAEGAPREVSRMILRLKMAVQKEDYDKVSAGFEELENLLQPERSV